MFAKLTLACKHMLSGLHRSTTKSNGMFVFCTNYTHVTSTKASQQSVAVVSSESRFIAYLTQKLDAADVLTH